MSTATPAVMKSRSDATERTAKVSRKEVADALPQAVITATVTGDEGYTLAAILTGGAVVEAAYPGWHEGADRRSDARSFIRRVIAYHRKAGIPFAYTKRRTRTALWVRVDSAGDGAGWGQATAEDYVLRRGLASRARHAGADKVADGSYVHKYVIS